MATFALLIWPIVMMCLFRALSLPAAVSASLIGGYLLLPTNTVLIDLPVLPPLDKATIPGLFTLLFTVVLCTGKSAPSDIRPGWLPRSHVAWICLVVLMITPFFTVLTNREGLVFGSRSIPGLSLYDGFSFLLAIVMMLIPFLLGRKVLATIEAQKILLTVMVLAVGVYVLLALWEIRMSPQLNRQLYGFFPHSWFHHVRGDGFRPVVFLQHGLMVAVLIASVGIAALTYAVMSSNRNRKWFALAAIAMFLTVTLSRALGATLIVFVLAAMLFLLPRRFLYLSLAGIACATLFYPTLRALDMIPTQKVLALAEQVDPERAGSFAFRVKNEDELLARAKIKPLFGWGGYDRNRVFDERGNNTSVTDGRWIILFGQGGWFRYISEFGLMSWALIAFAVRREPPPPVTVALMMALAATLVDALPNDGISPVTWLIVGALVGSLEVRARDPVPEGSVTAAPGRAPTRYARSFGGPPPPRSNAPPQTARTSEPVYRRKLPKPGGGRP